MIRVRRVTAINNETKLKGYADIEYGDLFIRGLRIVDGREGLFVGMPREKTKQGEWRDVMYPLSNDLKVELNKVILEAYQKEITK